MHGFWTAATTNSMYTNRKTRQMWWLANMKYKTFKIVVVVLLCLMLTNYIR